MRQKWYLFWQTYRMLRGMGRARNIVLYAHAENATSMLRLVRDL
jgi:hypothetical protein